MITEQVGPWTVTARLTYWDERNQTAAGLGSVDGKVVIARNDTVVVTCDAFRFPIGWRSGAIERAHIPTRVKQAARRVMQRLP